MPLLPAFPLAPGQVVATLEGLVSKTQQQMEEDRANSLVGKMGSWFGKKGAS